MPKFMTIVKGSEHHAPPPPALFEAIDKLMKDAGTRLVGVGGLLSSAKGARARLSKGQVRRWRVRTRRSPCGPRHRIRAVWWASTMRVSVEGSDGRGGFIARENGGVGPAARRYGRDTADRRHLRTG